MNSTLFEHGNTKSFNRHHKTITFDVFGGDCKICKKSMEKNIRKMNGIETVEWNAKKQKITVIYDPMLIDPDDMRKAIARMGFDTDTIKATREAYDLLEDCCKYTRQ